MPQRKIVNNVGAFAAATAISAAGLLTIAAPAQAKPMFPLAPACDNWTYPTGSFLLTQDNGIVAALYLREDKYFDGPASHTVAGKPDVTGGSVVGNLQGRNVDFNVDWLNGTTNRYIGSIADDGFARGTTQNNRGNRNGWQSQLSFKCATPPEQDFPPIVTGPPKGPVTADAPPPPPPTAKTATVVGDVDVYPAPNINDDQPVLGILRANSTVELVGACSLDDWCQVKGTAVPTGQGFIWGHLRFN